jgi:transcriptional regulator with XRE-family HTH domain
MAIAELTQTTTLRRYLIPEVRPSDLARKAGVSRQYVSAVLLGQRPPSERIIRAASELGIPVVEEKQVLTKNDLTGVARQAPQHEPDGVAAVGMSRAGGGVASAAPSPSSVVQAPSSQHPEGATDGSTP